jgi:hypothetical protein
MEEIGIWLRSIQLANMNAMANVRAHEKCPAAPVKYPVFVIEGSP